MKKKNSYFLVETNRENLIDKLIDIFARFDINLERTRSKLRKYKWPDITLSERGKDFRSIGDGEDILGYYCPETERITLYTNTIEQTATRFRETSYKQWQELKEDFQKANNKEIMEQDEEKILLNAFQLLMTIVLIHETAHWLVHRIHIDYKENDNCIRYSTEEEKDFHELLAQYFTYSIVRDDKRLNWIFDWLLGVQKGRYLGFQRVTGDKYALDDITNCLYLFLRKQSKESGYRTNTSNLDEQNVDHFIAELDNFIEMKEIRDNKSRSEVQKQIEEELLWFIKQRGNNTERNHELINPYLCDESRHRLRGRSGGTKFGV